MEINRLFPTKLPAMLKDGVVRKIAPILIVKRSPRSTELAHLLLKSKVNLSITHTGQE